jgi:hypothetical protein
MGTAFSGHTDSAMALQLSNVVFSNLAGDKLISFGICASSEKMTVAEIQSITNCIKRGDINAYSSIEYDAEDDAGLAQVFAGPFAAVVKATRFKVLVAVSYSVPYGITDVISPASLCSCTQLSFFGVYCKGAQRRNPYTSTNQTWILHSWI